MTIVSQLATQFDSYTQIDHCHVHLKCVGETRKKMQVRRVFFMGVIQNETGYAYLCGVITLINTYIV